MNKHCAFCKRKIHEPSVKKGTKVFCNYICEAGEELELLKKDKASA